MREEPMQKYVACKHRNVAAAYERFLGPSAGALPQPWHSRTWSGLLHVLRLRPGAPTPRAANGEG
jgi:hypothetical protein